MDYQGLTADDLDNIYALNRSFLEAIPGSRRGAFSLIAEHKMTPNERERLAAAPFLLFSFRESDEGYWRQLLEAGPQFDLIDSGDRADRRLRQLQVAGLSFLWQLARRNPYVVRLVCGASVGWCEQLSGLTLVELLQRVAERRDLLALRFSDDHNVWQRLLGKGTAASRNSRRVSHYCALQVMLTRRQAPAGNRQSAAACTIRGSVQQATHGSATPGSAGGIREPKV